MARFSSDPPGMPPLLLPTVAAALSHWRARLGADLVWFGRIGSVRPERSMAPASWWSGVTVDGLPEAAQAVRALDDQPVPAGFALDPTQAPHVWQVRTYRPDAKGFWLQPFARSVYLPHDLHEEHRLAIHDDLGLLGVAVAVWQARRTGVTTRLSRSLREGHARWIHGQLTAILRSNAQEAARPEGEVVVSRQKGVLYLSPAASAWLTGAREARLVASLTRATTSEPVRATAIAAAGAHVHLTPLLGPHGAAWLGVLGPLEPPRPDTQDVLTPSQRAVVQWVLRGVSAPEIAVQLGKSVETVRSQIKQAYARLGVTNRVELARALQRPAQ